MHKRLIGMAMVLLLGCSTGFAGARETPLQPVKETLLLDFLTRSERMFEWEVHHTQEMYRIWEGEPACCNTPENCPRQRALIRIQEPDLFRSSYLLPTSWGWSDPKIVISDFQRMSFWVIELRERFLVDDPGTHPFATRTRRLYLWEDEVYIQ
ncbi:MAG: hypothetical protein H7837_14265 [Magnetococcus sp. MYC-9]